MPYSVAQFCATVIDMSNGGASADGGFDIGDQRPQSSASLPVVNGLRLLSCGMVDSDSMPPARIARLIPDAICPEPKAIAARLEAHCRLTAAPGMLSKPRST